MLYQKEPKITTCLREVLHANWNAGFAITGEKQESVVGNKDDVFAVELDAFISNHGDCRLKLQPVAVLNWRRVSAARNLA
jgi:hypothetical protein